MKTALQPPHTIWLQRETRTGPAGLCNAQGTCPAKHHQVQQRVCPQAVGTMHRGTGCLPTGVQAGHNLILAIHVPKDLSEDNTPSRQVSALGGEPIFSQRQLCLVSPMSLATPAGQEECQC